MITPADAAPSSRVTRQPAGAVLVRIEDSAPETVDSAEEAKALAPPPSSKTSPTNSRRSTRALGFIALSALNLSLMRACVKYASGRVSSHQTVFWRSAIAWGLNYVLLRYRGVSAFVEPPRRPMLLFRSFVGTVGISIQFYAMSKMVLTDAVVIIFTSPIITFLLGALFLGEAIDRSDFFGALVSYVGVMFVTRPAFLFGTSEAASNEAPPLAVMCAFGGAFFQACSYIAMRRLKDVHYLVVIHYFLLFGIGYALLTIWYFDGALEFPTAPGLLVPLLASGVFAFVGQLFLTLGFQQSNAGIASVMRYLDVVFVLIWDVALLGEDVSPYSVFGGAIILAGASMIVLRRAPVAKTAKTSSE